MGLETDEDDFLHAIFFMLEMDTSGMDQSVEKPFRRQARRVPLHGQIEFVDVGENL
jgi:hypothetical protein